MSSLLDRLRARWTRRQAERRLKSIQSLHYLPHDNPTLADRRTALLFGTAALLSPAAAQAQVNPPAWQTGYMYVNGGVTVNTNIPNPTPYNLTNLNIIASANITTWNVTLPSIPFDGQVITISQGISTVGTTNVIAPPGFTVNSTGQGAYQFITNQAKWVSVQLAAGSVTVMGLPTVATIAAMAALSPAVSSVYLTDLIRGGDVFNWIAGNFTTQVINDPGQGITVAWSGDTSPGATGAWIRQYLGDTVGLAWFGWSTTNTPNQNATVLTNFTTWAVTQNGVKVSIAPGLSGAVYQYNYDNCLGCLMNIPRLKIEGRGAAWQNTAVTNTEAFPPAANSLFNQTGFLINTTTIGSKTVTLVTNQTVNFTVGQYVVVMSLDLQFTGFPQNCDWFDFAIVTAINTSGSTPVITLDRPLKYAHNANFPDANVAVGNYECGKARIWPLENVAMWNVEHVYEGLTILPPTAGGNPDRVRMTGRSITWRNSVLPGISPSIAGDVLLDHCTSPGGFTVISNANEPDKLVGSMTFLGGEYVGAMPWQSASIDRVLALGTKFNGTVTAFGKSFTAIGCEIQSFGFAGGTFGTNRVTKLQGCLVYQMSPKDNPWLSAAAAAFTVDGTHYTYANGVFTYTRTTLANPPSVQPGDILHWGASAVAVNSYTGDLGSMVVESITDTSTTIVVQTNCQHASTPSFASGVVFCNRGPLLIVDGCRGCDAIDAASAATKDHGKEWERVTAVFVGQCAASGSYAACYGNCLKISVNVLKAYQTAGTFHLTMNGNLFQDSAPSTFQPIAMVIDLTVPGRRYIDQTAWFNKQTNDTFTFNSITAPSLPIGWHANGNNFFLWSFNYTPSGVAEITLPAVQVQMDFDLGLWGSAALTGLLDQAGNVVNTATALL